MQKERKISEPALAILSECTISGHNVTINSGQLARELYEEVNFALVGIGGKWNRKAKAHVFEEPEDEIYDMLEGCMETGLAVPLHRGDYFMTPPETAKRLIELADLRHDQKILEPSAGEGALIDAILTAFMGDTGRIRAVDAIEKDLNRYQKLCRKYSEVGTGRWFHPYPMDFLSWVPGRVYDRIVMNPPFGRLTDIDHVTHAWELLKRDGRLVSVMSAGVTFRREKKVVLFRELVARYGSIEPLPRDSFKFSGTGVNTVVVVLKS